MFRRFSTMATITSTSSMAPLRDPPTNTDTYFSARHNLQIINANFYDSASSKVILLIDTSSSNKTQNVIFCYT